MTNVTFDHVAGEVYGWNTFPDPQWGYQWSAFGRLGSTRGRASTAVEAEFKAKAEMQQLRGISRQENNDG